MGILDRLFRKNNFIKAEQFATYRNESVQISFQYPVDWIIEDIATGGFIHVLPQGARVIQHRAPGQDPFYDLGIKFIAGRSPAAEITETKLRAIVQDYIDSLGPSKTLWRQPFLLPSGHASVEYSFEFTVRSFPLRTIGLQAVRGEYIFALEVAGLRERLNPREQTCRTIVRSLAV